MSESPAPLTHSLEIPDVNVLVALTNPSHQHHRRAHQWLTEIESFATTPVTEAGLVRLLLNPAIAGQPVTGRQAVGILRGVRDHAKASFLADDSSLAVATIDLIGLAGHRQTTDAHLVNLAAGQGAVLTTFDRRIRDMLAGGDKDSVRVL